MRLRVRTQVLIWMCALSVIAYIQRNLGVAESTLRVQAELTKEQMGNVQSFFFWSYALFQVPTGWLCQRWGPRFGMSVFCLTWSLATGLTGISLRYETLCLIRFLVGLGQAAALPCMAEVLARWFPSSQRGRATAWVTALMQLGALINAFATGALLETYSLQTYFWILAFPGILWSIGFLAWYRDQPEEFTSLSEFERLDLPQPPPHTTSASQEFRWLALLTSPVLWLISLQQFCRAAGYIFFASWFATYMQEARHYDVKGSGIATGCAFAGVLFGTLAGGVISDWILIRTGSVRWARQGVPIISLLLCAGCITGFYFITGEGPVANLIAVSLMTCGAAFSGLAGPAAYTVTIEISGKHVPTVFGCMNMAGNLGAAIFIQIIPHLLGPSKDQWDVVLIVFAALYLGSAAFWSLLNPKQKVFG